MRKSIISTIAFLGLAFAVQAQTKPVEQPKAIQDTLINIEITLPQMRALFATIDQNVDSKKVSKEILTFLQQNAKMVQPADKPKNP